MICKYIMFHDDLFATFPCALPHGTFKCMLANIVSAGFVESIYKEDGKIHHRCYGESVDLGLSSRLQMDSDYMDVFFNLAMRI